MVCDQTDGNVFVCIFFIVTVCKAAHLFAKRFQCVHIKDGIHVLNNGCKTFKTHTCINIFMFECCIISMAVIVELGKYVVPDLHIAVAVTSNSTSRFAAAVFLTAVIVDLRTWTARTCTVFPEVVFFAKTEDTFRSNTDFFIPDIECFIIVHIDGWIETVFFKTNDLC